MIAAKIHLFLDEARVRKVLEELRKRNKNNEVTLLFIDFFLQKTPKIRLFVRIKSNTPTNYSASLLPRKIAATANK